MKAERKQARAEAGFDPYRDLSAAERSALGPAGVATLIREAEAMRIAEIRERAAVPDSCGPMIAPAPARGSASPVQFHKFYPKGEDGWESKPEGYKGRDALRVDDVFARMQAQAERRKAEMPLTAGQIAMARHYASIVEHHDAGLVKTQGFDDARGGGGCDVMDAWLREREEIDALHARIGDGVALALRRVRPSERGARREITARALVYMVCVGDMTVREVLLRHGWAWDGRVGKQLMAQLAAALDRMAGGTRPGVRVAHYGVQPAPWPPQQGR